VIIETTNIEHIKLEDRISFKLIIFLVYTISIGMYFMGLIDLKIIQLEENDVVVYDFGKNERIMKSIQIDLPSPPPAAAKIIENPEPVIANNDEQIDVVIVTPPDQIANSASELEPSGNVDSISSSGKGGVGDDENIYTYCDVLPEFPGGDRARVKYLIDNIKFPDNIDAQGTIIVSFVIEKDGKVGSVTIIKSVHAICDQIVFNVVKNMPNWSSGKQNGNAVKVCISMPIVIPKK
jgi:hypothetical protein